MKKNKKIFTFNQKKLKNWFFYWLTVSISFLILVFLITSTWIAASLQQQCDTAKSKYEGDCVQSLSQLVDDESNSLAERNHSIWALGQMGDSRAKEIIEKYYTGDIPQREKYNQVLSQYEMKKALNLLNGSFNVTHLVWNRKNIK